jgi:hypothetical protein
MSTRTNAVQVGQRRDHADRAVPTHSQVPRAIEKNNASNAGSINWRTQQCADDRIGTTRLVYDGAAKVVVIVSEGLETIGERIIAEIRAAVDDHTSRLTARV